MKEKVYRVTIKGTKPLMHNRYPIEDQCLKKKRKRAFNPREEVEKCLYKDSNGNIYQPAIHIEASLIKSAVDFPWKGRKSFKSIVSNGIEVIPEKIPFEIPADPSKYEIDIRSVVNPNTRGRQPKARPVWKDWQFSFHIKVDEPDELDAKTLKSILINAGKRYGIGTYRQKFGRFKVKNFKEVDNVK